MPAAGDFVRAGDLPGEVGCRLRRAAAQSIPDAATTSISWDTEDLDTDGFIAVTSTTVTIPSGLGGLYAVTFRALPTTSPGTLFIIQITPTSAITGMPSRFRNEGTSTDDLSVSATVPLLAGDTFVCQVYQDSVGAQNFTAWLSCYRVAVL